MVRSLCPECGERPHYHSFCSRCCRLFMKTTRLKKQEGYAAQQAAMQKWPDLQGRQRCRRGYRRCDKCREIKPHARFSLSRTMSGSLKCDDCRQVIAVAPRRLPLTITARPSEASP